MRHAYGGGGGQVDFFRFNRAPRPTQNRYAEQRASSESTSLRAPRGPCVGVVKLRVCYMHRVRAAQTIRVLLVDSTAML